MIVKRSFFSAETCKRYSTKKEVIRGERGRESDREESLRGGGRGGE